MSFVVSWTHGSEVFAELTRLTTGDGGAVDGDADGAGEVDAVGVGAVAG